MNMQWLHQNAPHLQTTQASKAYLRKVESLNVNAVKRLFQLQQGDLDILMGGPPCQGYSSSNRQASKETRDELNNMVKSFLDRVQDFSPKMFLLENVQGVTWTASTDEMRIPSEQLSFIDNEEIADVKDYLVHRARELGYHIWYSVLDAADFGVPQHRKRFFLFGIRTDLTTDPNIRLEKFINPYRTSTLTTVAQAIEDLPVINNGEHWKGNNYNPVANGYITMMRSFMNNNVLFDHFTTNHQEYVLERFRNIPEGENWKSIKNIMNTYKNVNKTHSNIYRRLQRNAPSHTISHYRKAMTIHPVQNRGLSFREACRLQSFPDWYRFSGTRESAQQQLANAVPPLLSSKVALAIADYWLSLPHNALMKD